MASGGEVIGYLRSLLTSESMGQFGRVAIIGVANTIVFFTAANLLRWVTGTSSFWAVAGAFLLATGISYVLNRRWSFQLRGGRRSLQETGSFLLINLGALAVTEAVVQGAEIGFGPLDKLGFNLANLAAAVIILVPKFAAYRDVVFRRSLRSAARS